MLTEQPIPSAGELGRSLLRFFALAVISGLLAIPFPALRDGDGLFIAVEVIMVLAFYPSAVSIGFSLRDTRSYLASMKADLWPAFKFFLLAVLVTQGGSYVWDLALSLWGSAFAGKLLLWNAASGNAMASEPYVSGLMYSPASLAWYFFSLCVLIPVLEEFLFRRWLYAGLRRRLPVWAAVAAGGAVFGFFHGSDFAGTALSGFVFCWAYERTGRIQTPILVHAFSNMLAIAEIFADRLW